MQYFVGYFEIIATKYSADKNAESLDGAFTKPIAYLAKRYPGVLMEVFEDSLILGGPADILPDIIDTIRGLYKSWSADYILVNGGVSYGEVEHLSDPFYRAFHYHLEKVVMRRVSGPAVHLAFSTSQLNKPGMLCRVHPLASAKISEKHPEVLGMEGSQLIWIDPEKLDSYQHIFQLMLLDDTMLTPTAEAVIIGTLDFLDAIVLEV